MRDWLAELPLEDKPQVENLLREFRPVAQTWLDAANLPIDELILFLSQELFVDIADLAVAHKIAALLRGSANIHPEWRLLDFSREVADFCTHDRKFTGFSDQDYGFDPTAAQRQGGAFHHAQGQRPGVGSGVPDSPQQL